MPIERTDLPPALLPAALAPLVDALADAGAALAARIAKGGALSAAAGANAAGDAQTALDVLADDLFRNRLATAGVRHYASEEQDEVLTLDPLGALAVAIDPLDGSSNIDVNISIGTIFSIYPAADSATASVLRPAREQLAAGYIIYGPQCRLVATFGAGVAEFLLDPATGAFRLLRTDVQVPVGKREFAINTSNYRHWPKPVRAYIDDCIAGQSGPRDGDFNMRWIASLVAEAHRILSRGGIFLYPADSRDGHEHGRLRMVYEAAPIAMVMDRAGGGATDGCDPILGQTAPALHARTPLVFGSADKVARVASYHDLPDQETSALFGSRGLFRS
jgi:fructose-1,6-bisphosphatase I